ncbi:hypothetical protein Dimus_028692 [Dionaea muscipula]
MVAEPWILRMGNHVTTNLKNSLNLHPHSLSSSSSSSSVLMKRDKAKNNNSSKTTTTKRQTIGILSFEVANVLSKIVHLHNSLFDSEISKLRAEIVKLEGVKKLVSSDESYLLELARAEKLEDLDRVAEVVSRLGRRCGEPALQGFEHVYGDLVGGMIDVRELGFLVKDMEGMIRKMERYVSATAKLYAEMAVLNELENGVKKFQVTQNEESKRVFEQKLVWQRQDVRQLKDVSLWNQTHDKIVELMARTVCTLYARIRVAFRHGDDDDDDDDDGVSRRNGYAWNLNLSVSGASSCSPLPEEYCYTKNGYGYGYGLRSPCSTDGGSVVAKRGAVVRPRRDEVDFFQQDFAIPCGPSPGRVFLDCLSLSSAAGSRFDDDDDDRTVMQKENHPLHYLGLVPQIRQCSRVSLNNASMFSSKSRLAMHATPSTVGGSALALHYANVIIVIEKLLRYPHLVGEEARDDLYQMLPTSLRKSLRMNLKSYCKNMAIYDAPLAHDWKVNLDGILKWLAPLAHNMIRWQSERNVEQQQIVKRTNVLLLQTLYFADRGKTEAALCDLLVGLNYICRYEHQQNALLGCGGSFDFRDWMEWQLQCQPASSHLN